jgi:cell division protein FtsZ
MDRRQFLQSLNASSVGIFLPVPEYLKGNPLGISQAQLPSAVDGSRLAAAASPAWIGPKIGIMSVGGIGRIGLPRRVNPDVKFPYLIRSIAVDTYSTEFNFMNADCRVQLDQSVLEAHDDEAFPEAALQEIAEAVAGLEMVILIAGMGGTIGTTVTPIVAAQLKKLGVVTMAMAVMPYVDEGADRQRIAKAALASLRCNVNALLPVLNDEFDEFIPDWNLYEGFLLRQYIDSVYSNIVNPLCVPGWVNVEFTDLRDHTFNQTGLCAFGHGLSCGANAAQQAVVNAIEQSPLGKSKLQQARSALFTFEHGRNVLESDITMAIQSIRSHLSPDCHFLYGISVFDSHSDMVQVNILANGIQEADPRLVY